MSYSEFQPPSPSLSPSSQIKCYQDQLERAHSMIDQLEVVLAEKQTRKENINSLNIPKLKVHQKNQSLYIDSNKANSVSIKSYVTPRESLQNNLYNSHLSPIHFPSYVQEIQQKHQELLQLSREESNIKNSKIKEIQDQVQELRDELLHYKEHQRISETQKQQTNQNLESINSEIVIVQEKLKQSKDYGDQLEDVLQKLDQEKENHQNKYFVSTNKKSLKRKRSEVKGSSGNKPDSNLKYQLQQLRGEIHELRKQKMDYEEHYSKKITELEEKFAGELNANLSPNRKDIRIFKGQDIPMQLKLSNDRIDTLEDLRVKTESGARFIRYVDEEVSVQSFKSGKHQNRSCGACSIF